MSSKVQKQRNSAIELLRIISMVFIMFHHFAIHGGFDWGADSLTIPHAWYNLIIMGGKIGVDIFVLISGYYLINNEGYLFNFKKVLKFWGQVFFYSVLIFAIFAVLGKAGVSVGTVVKAFFPITFSTWWFASAYFVLYIIHPFYNKLLRMLSKREYQILLVVGVLCWSVIPTFTTSTYQSNSLLWFMTLYAIAGYAKMYGFNERFTSFHYFCIWVIMTLLTYSSSLILVWLESKYDISPFSPTYFYGQEKITVLLISLSLFMAFATMKMKHYRFINIVSSATFGVYLIHDNSFVRNFLWMEVFKNAQYQDSLFLIPFSILVIITVYLTCTIIDLLRQNLFEKHYMVLVERYSDDLLTPFEKIVDACKSIVFGSER